MKWTDWKHWIKFTACTSAFREGPLQHRGTAATQIYQDFAGLPSAAPAQAQQYQVRGEILLRQSWSRSKSNPPRSPPPSTEKSLCKSFPFITDFQHPFLFTTTSGYRLNSCHPLRCLGAGWASSGQYPRGIKNHAARRHKISHPRWKTHSDADTLHPSSNTPFRNCYFYLIADKPVVTRRERERETKR